MKILIGEDDVFTAEHLKDILLSLGDHTIEMAHTKERIIQKTDSFKPDIALLDIRMKNKYDGIEVGEYIFDNYNFPIIYITAHSDELMMEKALKTEPSSYILKPFQAVEVKAALQIAQRRFSNKKEENFILVKNGTKNIKLLYKNILFLKSDNSYIEIHSKRGKHVLRTTFNKLFEELNTSLFVRVHQSYAVNSAHIKEFTANKVKIKENWIPVSRKYKKNLAVFS